MSIVELNQSPASPTPVTQESAPESRPDLSGHSKEELASMLNSGSPAAQGSKQAETPTEGNPAVKPAEDLKPNEQKSELNVPDKFKNPDGSINVPAMLKSYGEAEKVVGRQLNTENQLKQLSEQNQALQQKLEELSKAPVAEPEPELTPEQMAEMTPQELQQNINKQIESKFQAMKAEQELQEKISMSINEVGKLDGAKELEAEITKHLNSPAISRHPDAPKIAYYAALGEKTPMIVSQARNMGYSEGYAKAKEEMTKGVDSGRASAPVESGNLSKDQIDALPISEHAKLIPRYE